MSFQIHMHEKKKNLILNWNVQDFAFQQKWIGLKMHLRVNVNALGMTSKWTDDFFYFLDDLFPLSARAQCNIIVWTTDFHRQHQHKIHKPETLDTI